MQIEDRGSPFCFDGRKSYINIRRPTNQELDLLEVFEMTSPDNYEPYMKNDRTISRVIKTKEQKLPGGLSIDEWQARLGLAPNDIIKKTFEATTQLAMNVEI